MISEYLRAIVRCPSCGRQPLESASEGVRCASCGRLYPAQAEGGYLDLRPPRDTFTELTDYAEEEFHHRPGPLRPPFLSARIKMDVMRKMLELSPTDEVLDIGCGNGRFVFFARSSCGRLVGIDAGAHFAPEPLSTVDLARGDVRLLPFADASFDKAFSLDVLEHLDEDGMVRMLGEARRVLRPKGRLFVYSHVMMSSKLAGFQRGVNRLVAWLDRRGLVDNAPERERKADHRNALRSYEQLDVLAKKTGFRIQKIRYYNVFFKALFEDLMLPLVEHNVFSKGSENGTGSGGGPPKHVKPDVGRWSHAPLAMASYVMKLDVALFGRVRTGPFFLLLEAI